LYDPFEQKLLFPQWSNLNGPMYNSDNITHANKSICTTATSLLDPHYIILHHISHYSPP